MKPNLSGIGALLLAALSFADKARAEFTVHEWGTLTTLSDASGHLVRWYLPVPDQAELPAFVYPGWMMQAAAQKGSGPDGLAVSRMETPVLYFYPEEEMNILVTASLADGKLPAPAKLDRVYVLRSEILTKARRETVAELITRTGDPAADAARLKALELGRFARGALASANQLVTERNETRFYTLQNTK